MAWPDAALVRAHKDAVVVLGILVQQAGPGEAGDHLPADVALFHQVGIHPVHIGVGRWQGKGARAIPPVLATRRDMPLPTRPLAGVTWIPDRICRSSTGRS